MTREEAELAWDFIYSHVFNGSKSDINAGYLKPGVLICISRRDIDEALIVDNILTMAKWQGRR